MYEILFSLRNKLDGTAVKNLPVDRRCRRDRFNPRMGKEEMATHSSILAWEVPGKRSLAS